MNKYIQSEITLFEDKYFKELKSGVELIDQVVKYLCKQKGKLLRPQLALYTAKILNKVNDRTYTVASLVEMIHVATLIHDDIVDESDLRRGWPTIGRIWKNKISVLIGDYLFSKALTATVKLENLNSIEILSKASDRLSKGEIFQIQQSKKKYISEDMYYSMIKDKTASLFSATCELSATTASNNNSDIELFRKFGENFGIAYQIKDDINDVVGKTEDLGKPSNFDLKRNMLTLPFIHCINKLNHRNRRGFFNHLRSLSKKNKTKEIIDIVDKYKGLEYANQILDKYLEESKKNISKFSNNNELILFIDDVFYGKK